MPRTSESIEDQIIPILEAEAQQESKEEEEYVTSRIEQASPYMAKFEAWCIKTNTSPTASALVEWDRNRNNSKLEALLGSEAERLEVGTRELYRRVFNAYYSRLVYVSAQKVSVGNNSYKPVETLTKFRINEAQGGVFLSNMSKAQQEFAIAKAWAEFISAGNKVAFLTNQTPEQIAFAFVDRASKQVQ